MTYVLVLLASINGQVYPSAGHYFNSLEECQWKGVEIISRAQPTKTFKIGAMCFEVHK